MGLILTYGADKAMQAAFPEGSSGLRNPLEYVVWTAALLGVTLLAAYLPARRAARIEPTREDGIARKLYVFGATCEHFAFDKEMPVKLRLAVFALVFAGCTPDAGVESAAPSAPPVLSDAGTLEVDAYLESAVAGGRVPKIVAIVTNRDGVIFEGAYGKQDVAGDVDVALDSIFNLASMTKPVTSVAVMMLAETGAFELDDPVETYLPEWAEREVVTAVDTESPTMETVPAESTITIRQLLAHTSGMAYTFSNQTAQDVVTVNGPGAPVDQPLVAEPGTVWNYSPSTAVLGDLVAEISGMPLDEFLRVRIFDPLEMVDTSYTVPSGKSSRVVTVHRLVDGELVENPVPETVQSNVAGDGGLYGTAGDYVRFLQMLLNGGELDGQRLLSEDSVDAMISNQIGGLGVEVQESTNEALALNFPAAGGDKFGLGFLLTVSSTQNPDLRAPGSYTWAGIFNTHFWGDPEREIAGVLLMQQLPFYDTEVMRVYEGFEERVNRNLVREVFR